MVPVREPEPARMTVPLLPEPLLMTRLLVPVLPAEARVPLKVKDWPLAASSRAVRPVVPEAGPISRLGERLKVPFPRRSPPVRKRVGELPRLAEEERVRRPAPRVVAPE